jgi:8-oxo-dGTP diphosphatase
MAEIVGGVIIREVNGEIETLTIRRSRFSTFSGENEFPRGHVDGKETYKQALIREVKEETNLDVEILHKLDEYTYVNKKDPSKNAHQVNFLCKMIDPNQKVKLRIEEHDVFRWIKDVNEIVLPDEIRKTLMNALIDYKNKTEDYPKLDHKEKIITENNWFFK